ncbi:MAG: hypothetical protein DYH05_06265 [Acidobacteria bacterium ACB1]|nr:hypothetical protein [Pyrinomonadaceae bacterium]MCE7962089.1 hypothetical protein [Acidobacteria bacterium ACB1]RIJ95430.1 MAG: hypothetical protein DCC44_02270 [Acidobacteriota bacterium]
MKKYNVRRGTVTNIRLFSDVKDVNYLPHSRLKIYFKDGFVFSMNARMIGLDSGLSAFAILMTKSGLDIVE